MIALRQMTAEDSLIIRQWPAYQLCFALLDYALRSGGWFDEFSGEPGALFFIAEIPPKNTVGFTLLNLKGSEEAEFRIALHPQWTGKGLGREITMATLEKGFITLGLKRILLIVRINNPHAIKLYERLGFQKTGDRFHDIQGKQVAFYDMEITSADFKRINPVERV